MNAVKEPTKLQVALDKRERYIDDSTDVVIEAWQSSVKAALDDAYEEGFEAGVLQGRHEVEQEMEAEGGPVGDLTATVKDALARSIANPSAGSRVRAYDNLIYFLEEGQLPPEWQP